jgi:hypothetical protein
LSELFGSKTIQHSGSITGFASMEMYLPDEDIFIVTLSNGINKNSIAATKLAACLITNKAIVSEILIPDKVADSLRRTLYPKSRQTGHHENIQRKRKALFTRHPGFQSWQMHFNSNTDFVCYEVFPTNMSLQKIKKVK